MNITDINKKLLITWCDKIESLQIKNSSSKGLRGGILCEGCGYIHGRCADVIYPMVTAFKITGDKKYLNCAENVFLWQKNNVRKNNGFNINDTFNLWLPVTEFYLIALGSTLYEHKDIIPDDTYNSWFADFTMVAEAVYKNDMFLYCEGATIAVNYIVAYPTAMAVAYKVTGDEKYKEEAISREKTVLSLITKDCHFYGETGGFGHSPKGHRTIDLGYNVEESIGNFALYAELLGRETVLKKMAESLSASAEFMLPDGAWDNSWGSRAVKWTYYGSRTSDGSQLAFRILEKYNPLFAKMCKLNSKLMLDMTYNGLLSGGRMYKEAELEPCVHHAFTHAKAVAYVVNHPFKEDDYIGVLPRENEYGAKELKSAGVTLVSFGPWRATIANTECSFNKKQTLTGGSITLLYHMDNGVFLVGNGLDFVLTEPTNMQVPMDISDICQTLRFSSQGKTSMLDREAESKCIYDDGSVVYTVHGQVSDHNGNKGGKYYFEYTFERDIFRIKLKSDTDGELIFPFVCNPNVDFSIKENICTVNGIKISANQAIRFKDGYHKNRIFNTSGGFFALPLYTNVKKDREVILSVEIK